MHKIKIILFTLLSIGIMSFATNDRLFEISKNIEIFINTFKELNAHYVDEIDPSTLMRTGIDAMVGSLDPYTNYISESQVESYRINEDVRYKGIGAEIGIVNGIITILAPDEASPLIEKGVKAGDKILKINNLTTKNKSIEEAELLLRGVGGTSVSLMIEDINGKSKTIDVERVTSKKQNVPYYGFVNDDIGYVNLTTFTAEAGKNIGDGIRKLKKENPSMGGLILDLRNNGGGLLREAINVTNLFVPKDELIVSTRGKVKANNQEFRTLMEPLDLEIPLVVLINEKSASASEIVSGAIQDFDRGVIVGQRSFGKGLVQNTKEVGYNSRVKLTTSKYYIPSGRCIQSVEYENGLPKDIDDSSRSTFKTKAGRPVLDGGGVTPDIKLKKPRKSDIVNEMLDDGVIFQFVNEYLEKNPDTIALESIDFSDYSSFKSYLSSSNYKYKSTAGSELELYEEKLQDNLIYEDVKQHLAVLKKSISQVENEALDKHQKEILIEINTELASRFYYEKGEIFMTLDQDPEIKKCIDLIQDQSQYTSILRK